MGATFSRLKNWIAEVLTNADLNAEIDNILNNLGPAGVDDYSTNAAQMKLQTSSGKLGGESLATSLAGELERLRFVIQRIVGSSTTYWYEAPPSTITDLVSALGSGLPNYRIASGRTTGNSSQLCALIPVGSSPAVVLSASVTPFVYFIAGSSYTISSNVTLSGLSLAASTNNTCSFNRTAAAAQQWTKVLGQFSTIIDVNGMNSSISSLTGSLAGFKVGVEYFLAHVNSTTALTNAWRGAFFNQSANNVTAVGLTDNDEIKLMRLAWLFATTASSVAITYTNPSISAEQPGSPLTGDYWFDLSSTAWKTFNSSSWVDAAATLIGITMQDTANCVAARTLDAFSAASELNNMVLERNSNTVVQAAKSFSEVNIFGTTNRFSVSRPIWDITTDLEAGITETLSTIYYLYMKQNGTTLVSDRAPMNRGDLKGLYHPAEIWRCLGNVYNNASTHFDTPVRSFLPAFSDKMLLADLNAYKDRGILGPVDVMPIFQPDNIVEVYSTAAATWSFASGAAGDFATLALTHGVWRLAGHVNIAINATNAVGTCLIGFSTAQGSNFGTLTGPHVIRSWVHNVGSFSDGISLTPIVVAVTNSTTYYFKGIMSTVTTAANVQTIGWHAIAERIDALVGVPS